MINDVILHTVSKFVLAIIFLYSIFLLYIGHYSPGGGFIGGLLASSGLVLIRMAFPKDNLFLQIPFFPLISIGLLISISSGFIGLLFNEPYLSQRYIELNAFGHSVLKIHTALFFDIGVYLVVVGITLSILEAIGGSRQWNS